MSEVGPSLGWRVRFGAAVLAVAAVVAVAVGGLVVWLGLFDVSALRDHSPVVAWLLHRTMVNSVAHNAALRTPPNLDDPALILRGATHFATGCAPCHGAPGQLASPIARRMTPVPPGLYSADRDFSPSQLFWIVRNGVKMTAMPAWPAPQRDDEIWAMVAFLEHLPLLNSKSYPRLAGLTGGGSTLLSASTPSPATPDQQAFDVADCARCHGTDGRGRDHAFPQIAGLSVAYIQQSLRDFRDGNRASGFMQPVAAALSDAQISQAAAYFSVLPRQAGTTVTPDAAALTAGAALMRGGPAGTPGAPGCFSCHLPGSDHGDVPDLTGQPAAYTAEQLRLYRSGERSGTPAAAKMSATARMLTDRQIDSISDYLSTLPSCSPAASGATACTAAAASH